MKLADIDGKNVNGAAVSNTATTHLTGSWLIIARTVWLMLVVPSLGLFVASLPAYYQQLQRACVDLVTCNLYGSLRAQGLAALTTTGFTLSGYAAFITIFFTIIVAIWCGVGFLIFLRRSDDWFALLSAFFLVMFNITNPGSPAYALAIAFPVLNLPLIFISAIGQASIIVFLMLFPNGRLVPRWMGLFLLLGIISIVSSVFPPDLPFNSNNWPWLLNMLVSSRRLYSHHIFRKSIATDVSRLIESASRPSGWSLASSAYSQDLWCLLSFSLAFSQRSINPIPHIT